jgi:hypothetical protein
VILSSRIAFKITYCSLSHRGEKNLCMKKRGNGCTYSLFGVLLERVDRPLHDKTALYASHTTLLHLNDLFDVKSTYGD